MGQPDVSSGSSNYVNSSAQPSGFKEKETGVFDPNSFDPVAATKAFEKLSQLLQQGYTTKKEGDSKTSAAGTRTTTDMAQETDDQISGKVIDAKTISEDQISQASTQEDIYSPTPTSSKAYTPPSGPAKLAPPPSGGGTPGPLPGGKGGTDNTWLLHPGLAAQAMEALMEANLQSMYTELKEGLYAAQAMTYGAETAQAEGNAIFQSAALQSSQQMIAFGCAIGSAVVSTTTAIASMRASFQAEKSVDNETKELEDNSSYKKKIDATKGQDQETAKRVDKYRQDKKDMKALEAKQSLTSEEQKKLNELKKSTEADKPGQKQWEAWQRIKKATDTTGKLTPNPATGVTQEDIDEYKTQQKEIANRKEPQNRQKMINDKTMSYEQAIRSFGQAGEQLFKGVDSMTQGLISLQKAAFDQQKVLLENRKEQISHLLNASSSNKKAMADFLAGSWQMLKQYSDSLTQFFKFTH